MSHKQRVEKVRGFVSRNRVFSVFAVILICFLLCKTIPGRSEEQTTITQEEQPVSAETGTPGWRFYPVDLAVLGTGGGFCTIMIIRERRKAKEGLN